MKETLLEKARLYEAEKGAEVAAEERPAYHVTGKVGWINDPNGFSFYQGKYHIFHQYYPYATYWGPMHWGHLVSDDLLKWEYLPALMAPDQEYDKDGCFSGTALPLEDGRMLLMYTSVRKPGAGGRDVREFQEQSIAFTDGLNCEKYEGNPVLTIKDLPEGSDPHNFRDPKVWKEDGVYYSVMVSTNPQKTGALNLFRSEDALHWHFVKEIESSKGELGVMWECPDFFPLDGKQVIIVSPMGMKPIGNEFHVGHHVICLIGNYDKKTHTFEREAVYPIDRGIDFYAPQTLATPDGRQVMIAWMQDWTNTFFVPDGAKFFGQLSIPREITIKNGKLYQNPIRELLNYRKDPVIIPKAEVSEQTTLEGIGGRVLDMTVVLENPEEIGSFTMRFAKDETYDTSFRFDAQKQTITLDRSRSGYLYDILHSREFPVLLEDGKLKLRFICDRLSIELFINDGERAATVTIFTPQEADQITFEAEGKALISVEKYQL